MKKSNIQKSVVYTHRIFVGVIAVDEHWVDFVCNILESASSTKNLDIRVVEYSNTDSYRNMLPNKTRHFVEVVTIPQTEFKSYDSARRLCIQTHYSNQEMCVFPLMCRFRPKWDQIIVELLCNHPSVILSLPLSVEMIQACPL